MKTSAPQGPGLQEEVGELNPVGELNVGATHLVQEMAEKVPGWLERILLPQLSELKGEIVGLEGRMQGEFKALHAEIKRLDEKIDALDKRTDVTQRLAVVEEQFKELRAKG